MKHTLNLLTAVLLAPLAELHTDRTLPGVPRIGKLHGDFFQALATKGCPSRKVWLEKHGTQVSNA